MNKNKKTQCGALRMLVEAGRGLRKNGMFGKNLRPVSSTGLR